MLNLTTQKIKFLNQNANFALCEIEPTSDEFSSVTIIDGYYLGWYKNNNDYPPTQSDLDAIDPVLLAAKIEADRKAARNANMTKDLSMVANYNNALASNPKLTFSDYLDQLEALQTNLT